MKLRLLVLLFLAVNIYPSVDLELSGLLLFYLLLGYFAGFTQGVTARDGDDPVQREAEP